MLGAGIVGGDMVSAPQWVVAVTVLGDLDGRQPVRRSGARPGDVVAVAGELGRSAAGYLLWHNDVHDHAELRRRHLVPQPPYGQGRAAADGGATAMTDVSDGLIADPLACDWDPSSIACTASATGFCLNPAQVAAVRKLYDGPRTSGGDRLYPGWQTRGSELNWAPWLVPAQPGAVPSDQNIATETLRYLIDRDPHPARTVRDVHFTKAGFTKIMKAVSGTYDATDPDLSEFARSGGKLIMWHGWADPGISPVGTVAYDQAMRDRTPNADRFSRLYLLPGVSHCSGGDGPDQLNALGAMVGWVEKDTAPTSLTTSKVTNGQVTTTRPVYPYPRVAVRTPNGWTAKPAKPFDAHIKWLGAFR